jgi:hypothetical protein
MIYNFLIVISSDNYKAVKRFTLLILLLFSLSLLRTSAQNAPVTTAGIATTTGSTVVVPVTVQNFTSIAGFSLKLGFNPAVGIVTAVTKGPWADGGIFSPGIDNSTGTITVAWFLDVITLPANTVLFTVSFTKVTTGTSALTWIDNGPSCEYSNTDGLPLNDIPTATYYQNGSVTFGGVTPVLNTKVFLEGPYSGGSMSTALRTLGKLPLQQPYSASPWNYSGTEQVLSIPADVTDWVLVELRTGTAASTKVASRAGFIKSTGLLTDLDGSSLLNFPGISAGSYYIVIRHRNHIAIMSATAVLLTASSGLYDFSTLITQTYGGAAGYKQIATGVFGMVAGDADASGEIGANDFTVWSKVIGLGTYLQADIDMNADVGANDFTEWSRNIALNSGAIPLKSKSDVLYRLQVPNQ